MSLLINIASALLTLAILWFSQESLGLDYMLSPVSFTVKLGLAGGCIGAAGCILGVYRNNCRIMTQGLAIWLAIVVFMNTGIATYMHSSLFVLIAMVPGIGLSLITFFGIIFTADKIDQQLNRLSTKV